MVKKECKGPVLCFPIVFLIFTVLWMLNGFGVFTWNIPWLEITFVLLGLGMLKMAIMHKKHCNI